MEPEFPSLLLDRKAKRAARRAVQTALAWGVLVRPTVCQCQDCDLHPGRPCLNSESRIEAHHADHSKPLEVQWLCNPCHKVADNRTAMVARVLEHAREYRRQGWSLEKIAARLGVSVRTLRSYIK